MEQIVLAVVEAIFSTIGAVVTAFVTLLIATVGGLVALGKYYHSYKVKSREPFLNMQFIELKEFVDASAKLIVSNEADLRENRDTFNGRRIGILRIVGSTELIDKARELYNKTPSEYAQFLQDKNNLEHIVDAIATEARSIIQKNWGISDGYMDKNR